MSQNPPRQPCPTCPWRRSTPKRGFPGGFLDADALLRMASGFPRGDAKAMQCHSTPDGEDARVCVGFALVVGFDSFALRLAGLTGRYDPDEHVAEADEPLHSLRSVIRMHGGRMT